MIYPAWLNQTAEIIYEEASAASIDTILITSDNITNQRDLSSDLPIQRAPELSGIVNEVVSLLPMYQPDVYVVKDGKETILPYESMGGFTYPIELQDEDDLTDHGKMGSGVCILPLQGGGRGPVINEGQIVDSALLLSLLSNALSEEHLSADLLEKLAKLPNAIPNSKSQEGYATHNDVITLDHDWTSSWPKLQFTLAHGSHMQFIDTTIGVAPDDITYAELPDQEVIYGCSGIIDQNQFTVKAAVLKKSPPIVVDLNWSPASIVGPPLLSLTTESNTISTTNDCMGFRVRGNLTLTNALAYEVAGTLYAQMQVDSGDWVNIAELRWTFEEDHPDIISQAFDVLMVHDQGSHDYKFRGKLVTLSDDEPNRELTGSIQIDTVTELGSGEIISNDLQLRWTSKE